MTRATGWRNGVTNDLGSTMNGQSSRANAANFDGSVIGGWQDGGAGRERAVWVNGVQELIFDNNFASADEVFDASEDGRYALA